MRELKAVIRCDVELINHPDRKKKQKLVKAVGNIGESSTREQFSVSF